MRIVFLGTPAFAVPCLRALCDQGHDVVAVYTQPDRPKGRGYEMVAPAVKMEAQKRGITVFQPEKLKGDAEIAVLRSLAPELIVVVAYGNILPQTVLDIPRYGCINIHASLLPRWRGAAPIQWAVIAGDAKTGVTSMQMDKGLDMGNMLLKSELEIKPSETAGELHDRLMSLGAVNLIETLRLLEQGKLNPVPQDDTQSCYAKMLDKELARIDFAKPAAELYHLILGLNPWPIATCVLGNETLKVFRARVQQDAVGMPGQVLQADAKTGFLVACGSGGLWLDEIQVPGSRRMKAGDYLLGHPINVGATLQKS